MAEELCYRINMSNNVIFVYLFTSNVTEHRNWAQKYFKIQGIFTKIEELMRYIKT
jgi:hypothetical protein